MLSRDGWPALAIAAATVAVELGTYWLARACGAYPRGAALAALAAAAVWVALATPVVAAGAQTAWGALLRGGLVADASAVALIVLWLAARSQQGRPYVTFLAAVKVYCTYIAMALATIAAVLCAKRPAGKYAVAVAAAMVLVVALATPLWVNGLVAALPQQHAQRVVAWAVLANPFYAVAATVADRMQFVWHNTEPTYSLTRIGDSVAPPLVEWYSAAWRYAVAAGSLGIIAAVRRLRDSEAR